VSRERLGIDVGGSSIKLARVDVQTGGIRGDAASIPLPVPSTPERVLASALESDAARSTSGAIGFAFPTVVQHGIARTAAHVDPAWIGVDAGSMVTQRTGRPCLFLNDADAAGIAEMRFGAGRGLAGVVFVLTLGTGIGSAPFIDGHLMPNTELGHLQLAGVDALDGEDYASARTRTRLALDWPSWAARLNRYLDELYRLFWPDAFILGGAVSEHFADWGPCLRSPARILPAELRGHAGVVGAALAASERYNP
jgi:polyphosphate glucokinase